MTLTGDLLLDALKRHFELDQMMSLCSALLGFDPQIMGNAQGKEAFARSLVDYCVAEDALQALGDAIMFSSKNADERLKNVIAVGLKSELQPGAAVGRLRVVKKIGESSLGITYLAEKVKDNAAWGEAPYGESERVALKVFRYSYCRDQAAIHRYQTAIRAMRTLNAPNLASIVDFGRLNDSRVWIATDLLKGQTLAGYIKQIGALHLTQASRIFSDVLEGLDALHNLGIVHGNIKSENVFILPTFREDGARSGFKGILTDGGVNRLLIPIKLDTKSGGVCLFPGMEKTFSPEQAQGVEPDRRSDIYAMGVLMYETVTGRPLFEAKGPIDLIAKHAYSAPEPPSDVAQRGWITKDADEIILTALAKNPDQRYQNAAELLRALSPYKAPEKKVALDAVEFDKAVGRLLLHPDSEELAEAVERQARSSEAWDEVIEAINQVIAVARNNETKIQLLSRLARISHYDALNAEQARRAYSLILELDPGNDFARKGAESVRRMGASKEGLLEILLDELEAEPEPQKRAAILREAAGIYEEDMRDKDGAFVAWLQVLAEDPFDEQAEKEIERLAGDRQDRWNEALSVLRDVLVKAHATLFSEKGEELTAEESRERIVKQSRDAQQAAEQALAAEQRNVAMLTEQLAQTKNRGLELESLVKEAENAAKKARQESEQSVARFESAKQIAESPQATVEQREMAERLGEDIDSKIEIAIDAAAELNKVVASADELRKKIESIENSLAEANKKLHAAEQKLQKANKTLACDLERLSPIGETDKPALAERRERDLTRLVQLYNVNGHLYTGYLSRPDLALRYFSQALQIDKTNDRAAKEIIDLHRRSQSWKELSAILLRSAEHTDDRLRRVGYLTEAANVIADKLGQPDQAAPLYEKILEDDPANAVAQAALEKAIVERNDWPALVEFLQKRVDNLTDQQKVPLFIRIAELYQNKLNNTEEAITAYEQALRIDPAEITALKELEKLYERKGNFEGLLGVLRSLAETSPTPKLRISYLERIGSLHEKEFVDHAGAIVTFERIIAIDPRDEEANLALIRLYRHTQNFEALAETLDKFSGIVEDINRRIELLIQCARVLMTDLGSPDRAMEVCERILAMNRENAEALELEARLKSTAGDIKDALTAIERLADQEKNAPKKAELLTRAGKLHEELGDKENAVKRYKQALDLGENRNYAADALRRIYEQRDDTHGIVELLSKEIEREQSQSRKAELLGDLGYTYLERLDDREKARECFVKALKFDPTCGGASFGLAEMAYEDKDYQEYIRHYETIIGRLDVLEPKEAAEVFFKAGRSFYEIGQLDKAKYASQRAREIVPDDLRFNLQLAELTLKSGEADQAEKLYEQIIKTFKDVREISEAVAPWIGLGESRLKAGSPDRAIEAFQRALQLKPDDKDALTALIGAYEEKGDWNEVLTLLRRRLQKEDNQAEIFALQERVGDIYKEKLDDREAAANNYVFALDIKPDDRDVLAKLMAIYSETKDWERLIEIVLRIAELVKETAQINKYYSTAAVIAHEELKEYERAVGYYEKSLQTQPGLGPSFDGLLKCLTELQEWERLHDVYRKYAEKAERFLSKEDLVRLLDAHGDLLVERLGRPESAVEIYEKAQELDPGNHERKELLLRLYHKNPKQHYMSILKTYQEYIEDDPYAAITYKALVKAFTEAQMVDELWCACQVLNFLKKAEPAEEKFFLKGRSAKLVRATRPKNDKAWQEIVVHPSQDRHLTDLFASITPALLVSQGQPLSAFGLNKKDKIDLAKEQDTIYLLLRYVSETTFQPYPDTYLLPEDSGVLSFIFSSPPSVGVGQGAKTLGPKQALAFVAARYLSYMWPGHFIRQMAPTSTGLTAWTYAAIQTISPKFPAPENLSSLISEYRSAIKERLTAPQFQILISHAQKLAESTAELNMRRWAVGVDLTADRVGFIFANDLQIAASVIEASPDDAAAIPREERIGNLLRYAVSKEYFQLRKMLGISLS